MIYTVATLTKRVVQHYNITALESRHNLHGIII